MDCPGCGAPDGYPPAGPCIEHGTMRAIADRDYVTRQYHMDVIGALVADRDHHKAESSQLETALRDAQRSIVELAGAGFDSERGRIAREAFDAISRVLADD